MKKLLEEVVSSTFTFILICVMFAVLFICSVGEIIYGFFDGDDKDEH